MSVENSGPPQDPHPYLRPAPVQAVSVPTAVPATVSRLRQVVPAFVVEVLAAVACIAALAAVAWFVSSVSESIARTVICLVTVCVVLVAGALLRRSAMLGRPPLWITIVAAAWGIVGAMWIPGFAGTLLPGVGWQEGIVTGDRLGAALSSGLLVQACILLIMILPALTVPRSLRGPSRGFLSGAACGLGFGAMQAVLIVFGRSLAGIGSGDASLTMLNVLALPVVQAFACGWAGALLGRGLQRGPLHLLYSWPLAAVVAAVSIQLQQAFLRVHTWCAAGHHSTVCSGTRPDSGVEITAGIATAAMVLVMVGTCVSLGRRTGLLRAAAMEGLYQRGWYTRDEARTFSARTLRARFITWSARRGARAQARHLLRTTDKLTQVRMEIEDLPNPCPEPVSPRHGLVEEQEALLHRSLSARESLRSAVAHGPGGWTAS